jgi:hypothetical protein
MSTGFLRARTESENVFKTSYVTSDHSTQDWLDVWSDCIYAVMAGIVSAYDQSTT